MQLILSKIHYIYYEVTDSDGNTESVTGTVIVNKKGSISIIVSDFDDKGKKVYFPIEINVKNGNAILF